MSVHKAQFPLLGIAPHINSPFGAPRDNGKRMHEGVDYHAPVGTPVVAPEPGRVFIENTQFGGLGIKLIADTGYSYWFGHLSSQLIKNGDRVQTGDLIGKTGLTGRTSGPHLHVQARNPSGARIDPHYEFLWG